MSHRLAGFAPVAAWAVLLLSCATVAQPRPEAVSLAVRRDDPQPFLPPVTRGSLHSGATLGVSATMAEDDVRASALGFMRAWLAEDIEALMELISEEFALGAGGHSISRQVLREAWQRQFARLDFTQFSVDEVVDFDAIEVTPFEERPGSPSASQGVLRPGDLLVRLRMQVTQRNRRRYFEDVLELWFRRQRGRWLIVALGE
jgi:hypothetical protein